MIRVARLLLTLLCLTLPLRAWQPLELPGGVILCHPRPNAGDTLLRSTDMDSIMVNGHLRGAGSLWFDQYQIRVLEDGRFAAQLPFPEDRLWSVRVEDRDTTRFELPLQRPGGVPGPVSDTQDSGLLVPELPAWVELGANAVLSTAPEGSYWLFPLEGTRLQASARYGQWLRVELGGGRYAWTSLRRLAGFIANPPGDDLHSSGSMLQLVEETEQSLRFALRVTGGPPVYELDADAGTMRIRLFNTRCRLDWAQLPADGSVSHIDWRPTASGELELVLQVQPDAFQGLRVKWDSAGLLELELPRQQQRSRGWLGFGKSHRLEGVHIMLDPGHGGRDTGCIGASATTEAELNLRLAQQLARQLRKRGARVTLTRDADRDLGLYERVHLADSLYVDFFLSLHYNSVGERENPWNQQGFSSFYYTPFSASAARCLHSAYTKGVDLPDDGFNWRSLAVCRQWSCPAVLFEAGSLIHPLEEKKLLRERFQRRQAKALARGIEDWFCN